MAAPPPPLPDRFLAALVDRDELRVTSRAGSRSGTVTMSFAVAPPGHVYLLTSAFSMKARRWERDPWVRLAVPGAGQAGPGAGQAGPGGGQAGPGGGQAGAGGGPATEGTVRRLTAADIDPAAEAAILERFGTAGAATPEALHQMLETGTQLLFRVEGTAGGQGEAGQA